jgi:HEAT repeat protein
MLLATMLLPALAGGAPAAAPPRDHFLRERVRQLRHGDVLQRQDAAFLLGRMGPRAQAAVPALIECLGDPDLRRPAALALGRIGPGALPALLRALRSDDAGIRSAAARGLTGVGPAAIPGLVRELKDPEPAVRLAAADALGGMGPKASDAIPALVRTLSEGRWTAQVGCSRVRLNLNGAETRLTWPGVRMEDEWGEVRTAAVEALREIGPAAVPHLATLFEPESGKPDWPAVGRLLHRGWKELPETLEGCDRDDVVFTVAVLLGELTARASALCKGDAATRRHALQVLQGYGEAARPALSQVIRALGDPDAGVRGEAVGVLARMGPAGYPAARALAACLCDPGWAPSENFPVPLAIETLGRLGPVGRRYLCKEVFPNLLAALRSRDAWQRSLVFNLVPHLGRGELPAFDPAVLVRPGVPRDVFLIRALSGFDDPTAVRLLTGLLSDADPATWDLAATALAGFGPRARSAAPALRAAVAAANEPIRGDIRTALFAVDPQGPDTIRGLTAMLSQKDSVVVFAASSLAQVGSAARPAIPALRALLGHEEAEIRLAAAGALIAAGDATRPVPGLASGYVFDVQQLLARCDDLEFLRAAAPHHPIATLLLIMATGKDESVEATEQDSVEAALTLCQCGPAAARHAGRFLGRMYAKVVGGKSGTNQLALMAIGNGHLTAATPYLLDVLTRITPDDDAYGQCLTVLERLQADPSVVVPLRLRQLSRKANGQVCVPRELARWGPDAAAAVPRLTALLWDADADCRAAAAFVLGRIGPAARPALDRLRAARADECPAVRIESAIAVARLCGDRDERRNALREAALQLPAALTVTDLPRVARDLARSPAAARAAVPALVHLLEDPDPDIRCKAAQALGCLGPAARDARAALRARRGDFWPAVADTARQALRGIPPRELVRPWPAATPTTRDVREALNSRQSSFALPRAAIR